MRTLRFMMPDLQVDAEKLSTALTRLDAVAVPEFARDLVEALEDDDSRGVARAFFEAGLQRIAEFDALDKEADNG